MSQLEQHFWVRVLWTEKVHLDESFCNNSIIIYKVHHLICSQVRSEQHNKAKAQPNCLPTAFPAA